MQANWSVMLNVLLLVGVLIAIARLLRVRKQRFALETQASRAVNLVQEESSYHDDIIAVRQIQPKLPLNDVQEEEVLVFAKSSYPKLGEQPPLQEQRMQQQSKPMTKNQTIMFFLLAKENRQFAGYELLQTLLACGLRFGEGFLFHRHQLPNGEGPILCSLAAATETGVFDLQNIGAFSVRGLCLFMNQSNDPDLDKERLTMMLDTAKQLSEGLDAHLLDVHKKPLTEERVSDFFDALELA